MNNLPLIVDDNIFDYCASLFERNALETVIEQVGNNESEDIKISFIINNREYNYLLNIHRAGDLFLVGTWERPKKVVYFPTNGRVRK